MIPYVYHYIALEDLELFARIERVVEEMQDPDLGFDETGEPIIMSCHMLARALRKMYPVRVCDGYFAVGYEHSWLLTANGNLIDPYPVAVIGGPIMYDGSVASPARQLYRAAPTRTISCGEFGSNSFQRSVRRIERALRISARTINRKEK